jgi:hypothetical protein
LRQGGEAFCVSIRAFCVQEKGAPENQGNRPRLETAVFKKYLCTIQAEREYRRGMCARYRDGQLELLRALLEATEVKDGVLD